MPPTAERYERPDLLDMLIILLLATALVIFMFWMASQASGSAQFQKLPAFVTNAYSAVWTTVVSGGVGLGLILIRRMRHPERAHPNYYVYVLGTALGLVVVIVGLSQMAGRPGLPKPAVIPNALILDMPEGAPARDFRLRTMSTVSSFSYRGSVRRDHGRVIGEITASTFVANPNWAPPFPLRLAGLNVKTCRWTQPNGMWSVDWFPHGESSRDSIDLDLPLDASKSFDLPPAKFDLPWPDDAEPGETWLCMQLPNNSGFIPIPMG